MIIILTAITPPFCTHDLVITIQLFYLLAT